MGSTREKIRQGAARLFEKSRKHQQSILKRSGFIVLCAILLAILVLWFHRDDPKAINYAADLIPGVLSILIAFVPDLRKQHMSWRIAIVVVGILGSILLYKKETLADAARKQDIRTAIEEANKHSDAHSDKQTAQVRGDLKSVDDRLDGRIATVNKNLGNTTTVVLGAFSSTADGLSKRIDSMRPQPPQTAKLVFSLWSPELSADRSKFPVIIQTLHINADGKTVDVGFTFRNESNTTARGLEVWVQVCDGCSFPKEIPNFEKNEGTVEQVRHRRIGDLHPGVFFEKQMVVVGLPSLPFTSLSVSFNYACDNCGGTVDENVQTVTVVVLR